MINALVGLFGITFMPVTTGAAALKKLLAAQGVNPYSIPFNALKAVAKNCYEITKFSKTRHSSFLDEYMRSLEGVSYAIADYCTKPFQECDPENDYIYKILRKNGLPPILTPPTASAP